MALKTLEDALVAELEDLLSAETQITNALPKMAEKATNPKLKTVFEKHLKETEGQIERLNQAFALLGKKATSKTCEATKGILKEGSEIMAEEADSDVMDAMLIGAAQKMEHYEIATYGTVCTWAEILGLDEVHDLLGETLDEEEETDDSLSELAEASINEAAIEEG